MAKKNTKNVGDPVHNIPIPRSYDPMAMEERIYKLEKSEGGGGGGGNILYARVTKQTNPTGWLIIDDANGTPIDIDTYMILSLVIEGDMSGQPPYYTSNLLACDTGNKVYATRVFNAFNGDPNQSQETYTYRVAYMPIPS